MRRSQSLLVVFSVLGAILFLGAFWQSFLGPEAETAMPNIVIPEQESHGDSLELSAESRPFEAFVSSVPIDRNEPETDRTVLTASEIIARGTQPGSQCDGDDGQPRPLVACFGPAIAELFEAEARDHDWATTTEQAILTGISQVADVATISTLNVECRETLCRSYVGYPQQGGNSLTAETSPGETQGLTAAVLLPVLQQAGLQYGFIPHPRDLDSLGRTYYFLRPENDLPAQR